MSSRSGSRQQLRSVGPDEKPPQKPATTVEGASERSRRELLAMCRQKVAKELDKGVPAYVLPRLVAELARLDAAVRELDVREDEESEEGPGDSEWTAV